jgi:predicted RNA-binding Zn ribbon-like protein
MTSAQRGPGGQEAFVFVGGCPSLDLVATLGRRHASPVERIPDADTLSRWFVEQGLLTDPPPATDRDLERARRLREAISAIVRSSMGGAAAGAEPLGVVNEFAALADLPPRLAAGTDGRVVTAPSAGSPSQALATIARDAARLLGGARATRIKECAHPECSLVFLDETQSGRRRWCSMDRCGNLVKIKGYRERRGRQS